MEAPAGRLGAVGARWRSRSPAAPPTGRRCSAASTCSRPASRSCCSPRASASRATIVQPLFDGAVYVALKAGVPIVPVGIGGSERVMPKEAKFIYPRKVHVDHRRRRSRPPAPEAGAGCRAALCSDVTGRAARRAAAAVRRAPSRAVADDVRRSRYDRQGRRPATAGRATPHSSRAECIDSCGMPTSTVAMPSRVAVIGPIVEPHGMLLRDTNTWCGTPAVGAGLRKQRRRVGRRRVALVGVDLDRRALVDDRARGRGRGARGSSGARRGRCRPTRSSTRPAPGGRSSRSPPRGRDEPLDARSRGAARRRRWSTPSRPPRGRTGRSSRSWSAGVGGEQRGRRRPARQPGCRGGRWRAASGRRRARRPAARRTGTAPRTPGRRRPGALGDPRRERRSPSRVAHTGRQVGLAVEDEAALVDVAVEVDGELRHAGDRLVPRRRASADPSASDEAPGDAEVAVEPAVEQHPAVDLDVELAPAGAAAVGVRLDAQARGVGVGADEADRRGRPAPAGRRHATSAPPRDDVAGVGHVGPRRRLVDGDEAGRVEQSPPRSARRGTATVTRRGRRGAVGRVVGGAGTWS